jgi:predicted nucleic acid-binding protein
VTLLPISLAILEQTAHLRATTNSKTPDAIHAATALAIGCTQFFTNDVGFRRIPGLPVTIVSEMPSPTSDQPE